MKSKWFYLIPILFISILSACLLLPKTHTLTLNSQRTPASTNEPCDYRNDFLGENNEVLQEWLSKAPGDRYKGVLKFVYQVTSTGELNPKPYFLNPSKCDFHWEFVKSWDPSTSTLSPQKIEDFSFKKEGRKYIFGAFSGFSGKVEIDFPVRTSFQLTTKELLPISTISQIQKSLQAAGVVHFTMQDEKEKLGIDFTPTGQQKSEILSQVSQFFDAGIPVVLDDQSHQTIYTSAWGVGTLRYYTSSDLQKNFNSITKDTILLLDSEIFDIPLVSGIITNQQLTPSSHLVFLAQMYGIPIVTIPKYKQKGEVNPRFEEYKNLVNKTIFMETNHETNQFDFVSDVNLETLSQLRPKPVLNIKFDPQHNPAAVAPIKPVSELDWIDISQYGGKSVQMGVLFKNIDDQNHHELSLGIPISFYRNHRSQFEEKFKELINSLPANYTYTQIAEVSKSIQQLIIDTPLNKGDLLTIQTALNNVFSNLTDIKSGKKVKLKLRSSSNIEDGEQFNGAGLYDSKGVCFFNCSEKSSDEDRLKKLESAIKIVWSSLYNARALWARKQFLITNEQEINYVGMGITVNPAVKNEITNGVVTAKVQDSSRFVVTVIESKGGDESADPKDLETGNIGKKQITHGGSEYGITTIVGYFDSDSTFIKLVKPPQLMRPDKYSQLYQIMKKLFLYYKTQFNTPENSLEIETEFKLRSTESPVLIKQVRRVPHKPQVKISDGSKFILIGGNYEFKVSSAIKSTIATDEFKRPQIVKINIPTITSKKLSGESFKATHISISSKDLQTNEEKVSTCTDTKGKITLDKSKKKIALLEFQCSAPFLGLSTLRFRFDRYYDDSQFRLLNSSQLYPEIEFLDSANHRMIKEVNSSTTFEMRREDLDTIVINPPFCQYSDFDVQYSQEELESTCSTSIPKHMDKVISNLFLKFQIEPYFGLYDTEWSYITKVYLFKKDPKNKDSWTFVKNYAISPTELKFTYVYRKLHDSLMQILIDLPNANRELFTQLGQLGIKDARYFWLNNDVMDGSHFIQLDKNGKAKLLNMSGEIEKVKLQKHRGEDE